MLIPGLLLKRGMQGRLEINEAITSATRDILGSYAGGDDAKHGAARATGSADALSRAKKALLWAAGIASQRFGKDIENEQEVLAALADAVIAIYATESATLRAEKLAANGRGQAAQDMAALLTSGLLGEIRRQVEAVLGACCDGDTLDRNTAIAERITRSIPVNTIALRRKIAARLLAAEKFMV